MNNSVELTSIIKKHEVYDMYISCVLKFKINEVFEYIFKIEGNLKDGYIKEPFSELVEHIKEKKFYYEMVDLVKESLIFYKYENNILSFGTLLETHGYSFTQENCVKKLLDRYSSNVFNVYVTQKIIDKLELINKEYRLVSNNILE